MKKSFLYIAGLIAMMAFSCTDEEIIESSGNELQITGSIALDSRTTYVEGDGVIETHWNVGDAIGLYTDEQSNLMFKAVTAGRTTEFEKVGEELMEEEGKTVYAIYPYQEYYNSDGTASVDKIKLYETNEYWYQSFLPILYSEAQIKNGKLNFQFKHLFAYLKIIVSTQLIKEIYSSTKKYYEGKYDFDIESLSILFHNWEYEKISTAPHSYFNAKTKEFIGGNSHQIKITCKNYIDFSSDSTYTFILPIFPQSEGAPIGVDMYFYDKNTSTSVYSGYHLDKTVPKEGLQAGHVYIWNFTGEDKDEKNLALLKSFYEKTSGDQWYYKDYWMSDSHWSEWFGINGHGYSSPNLSDFPTNNPFNKIKIFDLEYNNLTGLFPEEVAGIMDDVMQENGYPNTIKKFDLNGNNLYGPIPDAVKNHKRWNDLGWKCVVQNTTGEKELDLTNSNLYVENVRVEDLFEDESTVKYLYDIFKQNKLTQITGCDFGHNMHINEVLENFTDKRVNLHLDYQSKGLQTLYFLGEGTEEEENECRKSLYSVYKDVDGITWLKGNNNNTHQYRSSSYFYDSNGQLVYIAEHNPTCPWSKENLLIEKTDKFLRSILGEPVEHPEFSAEIYTSTDYSQDGEVVTLQEATVGQGINLTFLGEAFVDKDMESGGLYEQTMREAMEQFFSYEPYKSFRNRFNVYAVKAVSPNSVYLEGTKQAINQDNTVCFNYAQKIPNAEKNPPMVTVIYRDFIWDPIYIGRSHTFMSNDGSFIAYLYHGIDDASVLMHESGGHGFGKLMDEYVEYGNEELTLPEDEKNRLENAWTNDGYGANVDWRNDASTVKWSHFLNDSRYDNEGLGLYEGAYLYGYGAYRPTENSMMRYNNAPFNAPSREAIYKRIMRLSEGDSWTYDYEEFVKYDAINRNAASRSASRTMTEAEKREYIKNHQPPTIIQGTWRDAMKNGKSKIVVPLR